jgi:surface carbohydrate biosynthesis protein
MFLSAGTNLKISFAFPKECDLLQFGGSSVSEIFSELSARPPTLLPSIKECINLSVLLIAILTGRFGRWGYYKTFVKMCRARVILVWIDTNVEAYQLERHLDVPIWCFQNGHRLKISPANSVGLLEGLENLRPAVTPRVSRYFTLGPASTQLLGTYVMSDFCNLGSLRLNRYLKSRKPLNLPLARNSVKSIGFIVSFPNKIDIPGGQVVGNNAEFARVRGTTVSYDRYFWIETIVARALSVFAEKRNFRAAVIGKRSIRDSTESDFFNSLSLQVPLPVLGHEKGEGYALADTFDYLIGVDSTLGYEMLGLGKRVGFVCSRFRALGIPFPDEQVGHSLNWPAEGPFWTSRFHIDAVMDFFNRFLQITDAEWDTVQHEFVSQLIHVDEGNEQLRVLLREQCREVS